MRFGKGLCALAALSLSLLGRGAAAEEQRCRELGSNCVCSEPLDTTSYANVFGWGWNPGDSTSRECTADGSTTGVAIVRNEGNFGGSNNATLLDRLPQGHSLSHVLELAEGYEGGFALGHRMQASGHQSSFLVRTAMRWYRYYSDDYSDDYAPPCDQGSKIAFNDFDNNPMASYNVVTKWGANVYNFLNFTPPQDCCSGALGQALTIGEIRGKWIRYELVILNRGGPAFDEILYFKNITDNLPEVELWQLSMAGQLNDGTNLQPPGILNQLHSEMYRQGSCLGFGATSHFMIAGWDTDEGQRIGGAYEIEGAAGGAGGSGGDPSATSGATSTSATSGAGATTWGPGAAADESQSGGCACRLASPLPRHRWAGLALALALACAARRRYRAHGMRVTSG